MPDNTSARVGGLSKVMDPGERLAFTQGWLGEDGTPDGPDGWASRQHIWLICIIAAWLGTRDCPAEGAIA